MRLQVELRLEDDELLGKALWVRAEEVGVLEMLFLFVEIWPKPRVVIT